MLSKSSQRLWGRRKHPIVYVGIAYAIAFMRIPPPPPYIEKFTLLASYLLPNPFLKNTKHLLLRSSNEGWEAQVSRVSRILHMTKYLILNSLRCVGTEE